jgi:hypothetical protein
MHSREGPDPVCGSLLARRMEHLKNKLSKGTVGGCMESMFEKLYNIYHFFFMFFGTVVIIFWIKDHVDIMAPLLIVAILVGFYLAVGVSLWQRFVRKPKRSER